MLNIEQVLSLNKDYKAAIDKVQAFKINRWYQRTFSGAGKDCHYCKYAFCGSSDDENVECYCEDGTYFDHHVKDSKIEAERCGLFEFDGGFPKY